MLNDITSACWFTYLLVFLTEIGLPPSSTAIVMLAGQLADGLTIVFAGELIDRYGHFKVWHVAGSVLVAFSFSSVFGGCLPCKIMGSNAISIQTLSYSIFAAIFNVGWAATQVSHMSMVNCITLNSTSRVVLASCRNAFTMISNLSLYAVAFVVFNVKTSGTVKDIEKQYRWIAYTSIFFGCCFVGVFHLGTEEPRLKREACEKGYVRISWIYWFKKVMYYQVALVYVLTRLVTNVSQSLLAFYVTNDMHMTQSSKALVGEQIILGICLALFFGYIANFTNLTQLLVASSTFVASSCQSYYRDPLSTKQLECLCVRSVWSVAIGVANALITVSGVSMQSYLVGEDLHGCAFVYGSLSFLDKMLCGLMLSVLESYQSYVPEARNCHEQSFTFSVTRYGLGLVPAICALLGVLVTLTLKFPEPSLLPLMDALLS